MFKVKKNLYSLSSVCHAHEDIVKDLMNAEVTGSKQEEFVNDRIKTKKLSFYYPIRKNKLKTISTSIAERDMFNRVLVAHEFTEEIISLKGLSFFLSPIALSLSSSDGSLYKGCKASLLQRLAECVPLSDLQFLAGAMQIFDAMVMMQQIPYSVNTFGNISEYILN